MFRSQAAQWSPLPRRAEPIPSCDELERLFRRVFGDFANDNRLVREPKR